MSLPEGREVNYPDAGGVGSLPDVLLVVHTEEHEGLITIISARLAEPVERQQYFEGLTYDH